MREKIRAFMRRRTLAQRVFVSIALLIGVISSLYSFALVHTIEYVEMSLVGDIMREKITLMEAELALGRVPLQTSEIHLYGDHPELPPVPEAYAGVPAGYTESISVGNRSAFLYKRVTDAGKTLLLEFDQTAFEEEEQIFQNTVVASCVFVLIVAGLIGWWLGHRIVDPIRRLARRVELAVDSPHYQPLANDFADDEVGSLAKSCDKTLGRLYDAIDRERHFTSDVSHELRAPLTVIRTSAECLELGPLTERQAHHRDRILQVVDEMGDLLGVFLAFARQAQTENELRDDVTTVLDRMEELWGPAAAQKGLGFVRRATGKVPGSFSPVFLGVVAQNLVKNAVHYTKEGTVTVTETADGFTVEDTGPEIAEDEREKIFQNFFRGKASQGTSGSGVGLSIVKRIADRCGWHVTVESSDKGTRFSVTLTGLPEPKRMDERGPETSSESTAAVRSKP